jgi:hypothetical protein
MKLIAAIGANNRLIYNGQLFLGTYDTLPTLVAPNVDEVEIVGDGFVGSQHTVAFSVRTGSPRADIFVQWFINDVPIVDATDGAFTPLFEGDLTVMVFTSDEGAGDDSLVSAPLAITQSAPDAPVITNAGTIVSDGNVGKVGNSHAVSGFAYTAIDETVTYQWNRGGSPISGATSANYLTTETDAATNLTRTTYVGNLGGSDDATTAAQAITYEAPVAISTGTWGEGEDTGSKTFSVASFFTVTGDTNLSSITWSIVNAVAGSTIDSNGLITITTANALTGTITARATNSGGSADTTVALTITAPPLTPPVISGQTTRNYTQGTGTQNYNIASFTTGTTPITYGLRARVARAEIVETAVDSNIYAVNVWRAGTPDPAITYNWQIDGVNTGVTSATFDQNVEDVDGDLSCEVTGTNTYLAHTLETTAVAVTGTVVPDDGDPPVHIQTLMDAFGTGALTMDILTPAYSIGDFVLIRVATDHADVSTSVGNLAGAALTGPDGETIVPIHASVTTGVTTSGHCFRMWGFFATAAGIQGDNIRVTVSTARQIASSISVYSGVNTVTPIADIQTVISTADPIPSTATTATLADGLAEFACGVEVAPITATPAGWTQRGNNDSGAICMYVAVRDAVTTAAGAVASANFDRAAAGDDAVGVTYVINSGSPAVPDDWTEYNSPVNSIEPTLVMDVANEVYLIDSGSGLEEVTLAAMFGGTAPDIVTEGAIDGIDIGAGLTPRIALGPWWNGTEGTLVIGWRFSAFASGTFLFHINAGDNNNCIRPYSDGTNLRYLVRVSAATQGTNLTVEPVTLNTAQKAAFVMKAADFAVSANGDATLTNAAGSMPVSMSTLNLGHSQGVGNQPTGLIYYLAYYPNRIVNTELDNMTGV